MAKRSVDVCGETLRRLRFQRKLKGRELAELSGMSEAAISHIETGKTSYVRTRNADKLARALEVSLEELCGLDVGTDSGWQDIKQRVQKLPAHRRQMFIKILAILEQEETDEIST